MGGPSKQQAEHENDADQRSRDLDRFDQGSGEESDLRRASARLSAMQFEDDPMTAGGFGPNDPTIRVKPGPVRTGLIRPRKLERKGGGTFDSPGADKAAWMQGFLQFFLYGAPYLGEDPRGDRCMFNYSSTTVSEVVEIMIQQGAIDGHDISHSDALATATALKPPRTTDDKGYSLSLSYTFNRETSAEGPPKIGHQIQMAVTIRLRNQKQPGADLVLMGQFQVDDEGKNPSGLTGVQAQYVPFVNDFISLNPFVQVIAGAAHDNKTRDGIYRLQFQAAAGGQFLFKIPGFGGHLAIGGQAATQFTATGGQGAGFNLAGGLIVQLEL